MGDELSEVGGNVSAVEIGRGGKQKHLCVDSHYRIL